VNYSVVTRSDGSAGAGFWHAFERFGWLAHPYFSGGRSDLVGLPMSDLEERLYVQILVVRCQAGDEIAFAQLVERYGPRLRYYLQKAFGRIDGTDDALQDVWFDVFRNIRNLADPGAFTTWVYRIAQRRADRVLRRRRPSFRSMKEAADVSDPSAVDSDFSTEDAGRIHAALDELTLEHREVLVLRFLENMTYEDIASVTGCQIGTVKSRLCYAKRALRRVLDKALIHE
jgi:RNA polymerase sigma-70 factor (ECF subfamily)